MASDVIRAKTAKGERRMRGSSRGENAMRKIRKKIITEYRKFWAGGRYIKLVILRPANQTEALPGVLWIHGGGYVTGTASMVKFNRGRDLAAEGGAVVVSPEYRLAGSAPYPAALEDCYAALLYMQGHAKALRIRSDQIMAGGESAGGGLAIALCMYARDQGNRGICFQIPLYPMIDCRDTESSRDNHAYVWNTRRNHRAWKKYLADRYGREDIPAYASPARQTDYSDLPPAYTFVCDGEPFFCETLTYIKHLNREGIRAAADVYHANTHAFDMMCPWLRVSRQAKRKFMEEFAFAKKHYFADVK